MNLAAIRHRSTGCDCYALDDSTVVLNLTTGYDVKKATVFFEDPFIHELRREPAWEGKPQEKVVALPVKDPYHIIRNVLFIIELLERQGK